MIFSDRETADKVRAEAQQAIIDWAIDIGKQMRDYPEATDESVENFVSGQFMGKFPPLANTLLFKSGIIHASRSGVDEEPHYPVHLYYDNDFTDNDGDITGAVAKCAGSLIGGMVEGRIHT